MEKLPSCSKTQINLNTSIVTSGKKSATSVCQSAFTLSQELDFHSKQSYKCFTWASPDIKSYLAFVEFEHKIIAGVFIRQVIIRVNPKKNRTIKNNVHKASYADLPPVNVVLKDMATRKTVLFNCQSF